MDYAETDLAYNRAGTLSPAQKIHLQRGWQSGRLVIGGLALAMFGLGIAFYLSGDTAGLIATWIFAGIVMVVLLSLERMSQRMQREGVVMMVRGVVQRETEDSEGTTMHFLRVEGQRMSISREHYQRFQDGKTYRIYYVPTQNCYVVSGEPG